MKKNEAPETSDFNLDSDKVKEVASNLANEATKFIKKHPLASVGGALIAGFILGLLVKKKGE